MKEKNILYFTRTMGLGGTEKVILQLCNSLNKEFNKIIVCSNGGIHEKRLNELNIKHYKIDDIENKNILAVINNIFKLSNIIKNEEIDIIHTHHRMAAFYVRLLKLIFNFKFVHTSHNIFNDKLNLTKFSLYKAKTIAVGNCVKNNLIKDFGLNIDKVTTIYNAVEVDSRLDCILEDIKYYKELGYFIVGNIGRLSEQKGMEYYIRSVEILKKKNCKIKFFIVGDGEERNKLKELVNKLNLENDIIFLGYRSDVQNIMKQLDIVVLSSLWEGLPLTPIEAFSVGKSIIATNIDGTNEIVKNNYNGILVKDRNSEEIADAILELYNNPNKLSQLEINANKSYIEKFSYEEFANQYLNFYKTL